jgi:vacuolar-type H+-ATPase subunit E/Vma4
MAGRAERQRTGRSSARSPDDSAPPDDRPTRGAIDAGRVSAIVAAAEEAAERIRTEAESRMHERVAEGARAAENRIRAAEEEAEELLDAARRQAEHLATTVEAEAEDTRTRAAERAGEEVRTAEAQAARLRDDAQLEADGLRDDARASADRERVEAAREAQELVVTARAAADAARDQGRELTGNLLELSGSLRANAERLMRDIHRTHQALTAQLDAVEGIARPWLGGEGASDPARRGEPLPRAEGDFDVPDFIPSR